MSKDKQEPAMNHFENDREEQIKKDHWNQEKKSFFAKIDDLKINKFPSFFWLSLDYESIERILIEDRDGGLTAIPSLLSSVSSRINRENYRGEVEAVYEMSGVEDCLLIEVIVEDNKSMFMLMMKNQLQEESLSEETSEIKQESLEKRAALNKLIERIEKVKAEEPSEDKNKRLMSLSDEFSALRKEGSLILETASVKEQLAKWDEVKGGGWIVIGDGIEQTRIEWWNGSIRRVINCSFWKKGWEKDYDITEYYGKEADLLEDYKLRLDKRSIEIKPLEDLNPQDLDGLIKNAVVGLKAVLKHRRELPKNDPRVVWDGYYFSKPVHTEEYGQRDRWDKRFTEAPMAGERTRLMLNLSEADLSKIAEIQDGSVEISFEKYRDKLSFSLDLVAGKVRRLIVKDGKNTTYKYSQENQPAKRTVSGLSQFGIEVASLDVEFGDGLSIVEFIKENAEKLKESARAILDKREVSHNDVIVIGADFYNTEVFDGSLLDINRVLEEYDFISHVEGMNKIDEKDLLALAKMVKEYAEDMIESGMTDEYQYNFLATYSQEEHELNRDGNQGLGASAYELIIPDATDDSKRVLYFSVQWGD